MKRTHIFLCSMLAAIIACQSTVPPVDTTPTNSPTGVITATFIPSTTIPIVEGQMLTNNWDKEVNILDGESPKPSALMAVDWQNGSGTVRYVQSYSPQGGINYICHLTTLSQSISKSYIVTASYHYQVIETLIDNSRLLLVDTTDYEAGAINIDIPIAIDAKLVTISIGIDKPDNFDAIHYQFLLTSLYCTTFKNSKETNLR